MKVYFNDLPECQKYQFINKITADLFEIVCWEWWAENQIVNAWIIALVVGKDPIMDIDAYDHQNTGDYLPKFNDFSDYTGVITHINKLVRLLKTSGSTDDLNPKKHG